MPRLQRVKTVARRAIGCESAASLVLRRLAAAVAVLTAASAEKSGTWQKTVLMAAAVTLIAGSVGRSATWPRTVQTLLHVAQAEHATIAERKDIALLSVKSRA